jgi:hypothetical protein
MIRTLVALAAGIGVGVAGMTATQHEGVKVTTLAARDIVEKLDGKEAKVTFVEVTLEAGQADVPHRHPPARCSATSWRASSSGPSTTSPRRYSRWVRRCTSRPGACTG